jgi:hypothetical protein
MSKPMGNHEFRTPSKPDDKVKEVYMHHYSKETWDKWVKENPLKHGVHFQGRLLSKEEINKIYFPKQK